MHRSALTCKCFHHGQWQLETQWTAHTFTCSRILMYRLPGGGGRGCALLHSSVSGRVTMETGYGWKQQEKEIMGFASPPLMNSRFCHCLYMVVFKEHPCKLWTVGSLNGLWWIQSSEGVQRQAILFVNAVYNICLYYRVNSKLEFFLKMVFHDLVLHILV